MAKRKRAPARRKTTRKTAHQANKSRHQAQLPGQATRRSPATWRGVPIEYTPELLENARYRFEETDETLTSIAAELGVHRNTLRLLALRMSWKRYVPPRDLSPAAKLLVEAKRLTAPAPLQSTEQTAPTQRDAEEQAPKSMQSAENGGEPGAANDDAALAPSGEPPLPPLGETIERMHRAVLKELSAVETMRAALGREPQSPIDAQRTASTLARLTETLQKLQRLQCATPQTGPYDDDMPADIDEFRRDLARRIDAFVESRTNAGAVGTSAV